MLPKPLEISLMVTTKCQVNCLHCCQGSWRYHFPDYHMSLPELRNFIHYTKLSGYVYDLIIISGGEPLLWEYLVSGVDIIRSSGITKKLTIFTNGIQLEYFRPSFFNLIYNKVDSIRVTNLGINSNLIIQMKDWLSQYNKFYFIDYSDFIIMPEEPISNSLPADCGCPHFSFTQGRLNICTLARDLFLRHPVEFDGPEHLINLSLCKNYLDKLIPWRKFDFSICQYCISNNKFRDKLEREPNKSIQKDIISDEKH